MERFWKVVSYKGYFEAFLKQQPLKGQLIILLNGFQKKKQKTPRKEVEKAVRLMNEYYKEKEGKNEKN